MSNLSTTQFFLTPTHPCSYLDKQQASTLFADPTLSVDKLIYSSLAENGFRRSGNHLYRPHCEQCNACIPVRVLVNEFTMNKSQRRLWRKHQAMPFTLNWIPASCNDEYYQLYERYIRIRHHDGDMYPPSMEQFNTFLLSDWSTTMFLELRESDTNRLLSVAVTDQLQSGLSSIYTFFDPHLEGVTLGIYSILLQIMAARQQNLPYLFLGYWIKEAKKMSYKNKFRPYEIYINDHWERVGA